MIITKFNSLTGILDTKFTGDITAQEIIEYIVDTRNNTSYPRSLKILTDATEANMLLNKNDLSPIVKENIKSLEKYDYMIDAIVISSPKEAALSMLFMELTKTEKYKFKVFSTRTAANYWLETNSQESLH